MKKLITLSIIAILFTITSCDNNSKEKVSKEKTVENTETTTNDFSSKDYIVSTEKSIVKWTGNGVGHGHKGTIKVASGKFSMQNGIISRGKVSMDMNSIVITDIKDPKDLKDLSNHFKNDDFFSVNKFPISSLEIIDASDMNNVKAKMIIKGKTQDVSFPASISKVEGKMNLNIKMEFDRTKFGITYNSGNFFKNLGNYLINDMIGLEIVIVEE